MVCILLGPKTYRKPSKYLISPVGAQDNPPDGGFMPLDDSTVCGSTHIRDACFGGWKSLHDHHDYTGWGQAEAICAAVGARLCTVEELQKDEPNQKEDENCFAKMQYAASSESCDVEVCGQGATTTGGTAPEGTPCAFPFVFDGVTYNECMWAEQSAAAASIYGESSNGPPPPSFHAVA